jgi:predicted GIY-YIG superfamily endonuclease
MASPAESNALSEAHNPGRVEGQDTFTHNFHSTHLQLAYGKLKVRSWRAPRRRSGRIEDHCTSRDDDAIVVFAVHFVYILRCADNALYVGETNNPDVRLMKHQEGTASRFTARRRPVTLVYVEEWPNRLAALARERQIKRWTRAKKEALAAGDFVLLKRL